MKPELYPSAGFASTLLADSCWAADLGNPLRLTSAQAQAGPSKSSLSTAAGGPSSNTSTSEDLSSSPGTEETASLERLFTERVVRHGTRT